MMISPIVPFILFAVITFLHYLSLIIEYRYFLYTKIFGKLSFTLHCIITGILWFVLFLSFVGANKDIYPLFSMPVYMNYLGLLLLVLGLLLIITASYYLGLKRAWGIRYFNKEYKERIELRGPYKLLKNPIYDGFFLYFLGKGLFNNSVFYMLISIESYVLLNILLSSFENKEI